MKRGIKMKKTKSSSRNQKLAMEKKPLVIAAISLGAIGLLTLLLIFGSGMFAGKAISLTKGWQQTAIPSATIDLSKPTDGDGEEKITFFAGDSFHLHVVGNIDKPTIAYAFSLSPSIDSTGITRQTTTDIKCDKFKYDDKNFASSCDDVDLQDAKGINWGFVGTVLTKCSPFEAKTYFGTFDCQLGSTSAGKEIKIILDSKNSHVLDIPKQGDSKPQDIDSWGTGVKFTVQSSVPVTEEIGDGDGDGIIDSQETNLKCKGKGTKGLVYTTGKNTGCPKGDLTGDGCVNKDDLKLIIPNIDLICKTGQLKENQGDLTGDGCVNKDDLKLIITNIDLTCGGTK